MPRFHRAAEHEVEPARQYAAHCRPEGALEARRLETGLPAGAQPSSERR